MAGSSVPVAYALLTKCMATGEHNLGELFHTYYAFVVFRPFSDLDQFNASNAHEGGVITLSLLVEFVGLLSLLRVVGIDNKKHKTVCNQASPPISSPFPLFDPTRTV